MTPETPRTWNITMTPPGEPASQLAGVSHEDAVALVWRAMYGRPMVPAVRGDDHEQPLAA
jgi:hypothetical protein